MRNNIDVWDWVYFVILINIIISAINYVIFRVPNTPSLN